MRKSAPIRQLSLHVETPQSRRTLKKQLSEDIPDFKEKLIVDLDPYVAVCTKNLLKTRNSALHTKQAWVEEGAQQVLQQSIRNNEEGLVAKKCKEMKRPLTSKIIKQSSINKDSILLSHQELAERLRQAWKEREKEKQNLNIFLTHNIKERQEDEVTNDLTDSECAISVDHSTADGTKKQKTALQRHISTNENSKSIFQKRMRRTHSVDDAQLDFIYSPVKNEDIKNRNVVVVPLIESMKLQESNSPKPEVPKPKLTRSSSCEPNAPSDERKPINVIIRPMTATTKRDAYRSRVNSAFNTSNSTPFTKENPRPPQIRASPALLKPSPKLNFVPVKRRLKSASKKKSGKLAKSESIDERDEEKYNSRKLQRCVTTTGPDVVTMVSLLSPEESETEEQPESEKVKPKPTPPAVSRGPSLEKNEKDDSNKSFHLRKTVSFQQSSIYAVRSFSASFPARRGSVVTALMLNSSNSDKCANLEKRTTQETGTDDGREPKRRLLRTKSNSLYSSTELEESTELQCENKNPSSTTQNGSLNGSNDVKLEVNESPPSSNEPAFETPKEKQCWEMYRKMSGKGVRISFETILRGMLTPTEYRLRRKSNAALENVEDNTADSVS
ncbi:hypothetical protein PPYR_10898 [Photinus pyralis]|uniref:Uncharacterized protein n=1 Tax=Photinus pyralis TaxID=7054 RepID=A0A5N4AHN6_PHOPY|nr:uncharacterized protein LOC116173516 [Photinus pyralis]KAB0796837.1 hypothetical protein PPYR_10898 [Photinus pyralis]